MQRAYRNATLSPDPSTQNGAVLLAENGVQIGEGCNDFPRGVNPVHWTGPKEGKYARVVHAETAAIFDASRKGNYTLFTTLVCPWAACSNCAKHIAAAGVSRLVRHTFTNNGVTDNNHWYADCQIGDEILREAGIEIIEIEPVPTDIKLRRDGSIWTP